MNNEKTKRLLLNILKPYKKFIVKIRDGVFLKTRFGVQKLRDNKMGLYLKNGDKRNIYLHRWNKNSFGSGSNVQPRHLFQEFNRALTPSTFPNNTRVHMIDPVTGQVALGNQVFIVIGQNFNPQTRIFSHNIRMEGAPNWNNIWVTRDMLREVPN
tara:strand:- start:868 stop:1332 length:465 start_codon:yes stop_codon:yes gene_type:complete